MAKPKSRLHQERRRGIFRTVAILAVVVLFIYLFFVGRGVFNYFA